MTPKQQNALLVLGLPLSVVALGWWLGIDLSTILIAASVIFFATVLCLSGTYGPEETGQDQE